jgi:hypothetical protein
METLIETDELKPEATSKIFFENVSSTDRVKYMDSVKEVFIENLSFSDKNIKVQRKELKDDGLSNKAINKTMLRNIINAKKGFRKTGNVTI